MIFCVLLLALFSANAQQDKECEYDFQYMCHDGLKCIPKKWLCDRIKDCNDSSDEAYCVSAPVKKPPPTTQPPFACNSTQFRCKSVDKCIPDYWVCDNYNDCGDGSDEANCSYTTAGPPPTTQPSFTTPGPQHTTQLTCSDQEVMCKHGKECIEKGWWCDGYYDCSDSSDEANCNKTTQMPPTPRPTTSKVACSDSSQVLCKNGHQCIPKSWWCDNIKDCTDNSDESNCNRTTQMPTTQKPTTNLACPSNKVACHDGSKCIWKSWWCDEIKDCPDKSDENSCAGTTQPPPTTEAPPPTLPSNQTYPPIDTNCGKINVKTSKVIGGKNAVPGGWPWQVALKYYGGFQCGGSLIAPQWVVTAAHCTEGNSPDNYVIVTGEYNRHVPEGREASYDAEALFNHPDYSSYTLNNDIALIKLKKPVVMGKYVSTVCLPGSPPPVGKECYITGWGKIQHPGSSHNILQQALMKVVDHQTCYDLNTAKSNYPAVTNKMVCAGHGPGDNRSGCHGDSGGPFVCQAPTGKWELQGAVSWGSPSCDTDEAYTAFARVTEFKPWIQQIINNN